MSTWPASISLLLLVLGLFSTQPALGQQQFGFEYIQSPVGGEASIFLNLWGNLGGCGAGTSEDLYVVSVAGSILGETTISPSQSLAGPEQAPFPDNCVSLTGRTLDSNGLGPLNLVPINNAFWLLINNISSPDQPDNYTLITALPINVRFNTYESSSLQPPVLVPLTGPSAGPSVGLLFNGGFEQTLSAESINASQDMAAGWTGNYTVMQYSSGGSGSPPIPAGLPGQSSTSQRQYVSLLPGGGEPCPEAAELFMNCSAGLSQGSLPLTLGLDYSLSWHASCGAVDDAAEPCSYSVVAAGPFLFFGTRTTTTVYYQTNSSWQQHSFLFDVTVDNVLASAPANALITFTPLTGNPLIDSVVLTYATDTLDYLYVDELAVADLDTAFYDGSLIAQTSGIPGINLTTDNTDAANITDFLVVLPGGLVESGVLVHTYPNYSWLLSDNLDVRLQGGRNWTLSVTATAFEAADDAVISLFLSFSYIAPNAGGSTSGGGYTAPQPPPCTKPSGSEADCGELSTPHPTPTRRRLLQLEPTEGYYPNAAYYSCSVPGYPCNNSVLSVTVNVPDMSYVYETYVQVVVFDMNVAITDIQLSWQQELPALSITSDTSGAMGDPQFTGLLGQRFQVHGVSGTVYNIITDSLLQVNARFDFLSSGSGPRADIIDTQPWTHPGTYMGAMSFQVRSSVNTSHIDVVVVEAGGSSEGFARVSINGEQVTHPYTWQPKLDGGDASSAEETVAVSFAHSHVLEVQTSQFHFRLVNSDYFINHDVAPRVPLRAMSCHGLLGQTRLNKQYKSALRYIEGSVDDYAVGTVDEEGAMLGVNFVYNMF